MKKRRLLAIVAATAMMLSTAATAFADPVTSTGDTTVNGEGDVQYDELATVYSVTLPTAEGLAFTLDPQGLATLDNGESAKLEDLLKEGGNIVTADNAGAYIRNESSAAVKVTVKAKITDTNDTAVTAVDTYEEVAEATDPTICLVAVPGSATKPADMAAHTDSATGIVIDKVEDAGTTDFSYVLGAADYVVAKDESSGAVTLEKDTSEEANTYDAATFKLTGKVATQADWSAYTGAEAKKIGISATFTIADATTSDVAGTQAYGLMQYAGTTVTVTPSEKAPEFTASGATISYTKGSGDLALKSITSIKMTNTSGTYDGYNGNGSYYSAATDNGSTITFDSKFLAFYTAGEQYDAVITYVNEADDTKTQTVKVTIPSSN